MKSEAIENFDLFSHPLYKKIDKYKLHHIFLWLLYLVFWIIVFRPGDDYSSRLVNSLAIVSVHALISYINLSVLIRLLLVQKQYLIYFACVLLVISMGAFIQMAVFILLNTLPPEQKVELVSLGFFINSAIAITYTVAITMSLKLVKYWYEKEQMAKNLEQLNRQTELLYLQAQINPHFLFNSLNSIYGMALKQAEKTPDLILQLSEILRYVLYEGKGQWVSLANEIKYLKCYIELEKTRYEGDLEVSLEVDGEAEDFEIASMLIIPFVENSFKHGLSARTGNLFLRIKVKVENNQLEVEIVNSKPSSHLNSTKPQNYIGGIGIQNVKKRLAMIYPNSHQLTIRDEEDLFYVKLTIDSDKS